MLLRRAGGALRAAKGLRVQNGSAACFPSAVMPAHTFGELSLSPAASMLFLPTAGSHLLLADRVLCNSGGFDGRRSMFIEVHATPNINRSKEAHAPHKSTPKMHAKNAQTHAKNACHRIPCQRNACNHNTVQTIANKFAPECTKPTRHAHVQLPVHGQLEISSRAVSLEGWHLRFPERPRSEPPPTLPCQSHFSLGRAFWTHFLILGPIFVFGETAPTGQAIKVSCIPVFGLLVGVATRK